MLASSQKHIVQSKRNPTRFYKAADYSTQPSLIDWLTARDRRSGHVECYATVLDVHTSIQAIHSIRSLPWRTFIFYSSEVSLHAVQTSSWHAIHRRRGIFDDSRSFRDPSSHRIRCCLLDRPLQHPLKISTSVSGVEICSRRIDLLVPVIGEQAHIAIAHQLLSEEVSAVVCRGSAMSNHGMRVESHTQVHSQHVVAFRKGMPASCIIVFVGMLP